MSLTGDHCCCCCWHVTCAQARHRKRMLIAALVGCVIIALALGLGLGLGLKPAKKSECHPARLQLSADEGSTWCSCY